MMQERKFKMKPDGLTKNSDGTFDIDLESVNGKGYPEGWLLCSEKPEELDIPEGYEIDPDSTLLVNMTFHFGIRKKS